MNITPELLSDLYPHFFWETYLLQYCASSRLAKTQSIYLLVRNFSSLRTEQWSGGQNGSRRCNILGRGEQEAKLMLLSKVNGGCSQRPADPGKVQLEHEQIKFREVKAVRQQDQSYKYIHLCKKNIEGMGMIENN